MAEYASRAVDALHSYLETNLQTYLTAVETDEGMGAGDLTAPADFVKGLKPRDNRSPLLMVYSEGGEPIDVRNGIYAIDCRVALGYTGTFDIEAGHKFLDRYMSAVIGSIRVAAGYTLSDATGVVHALPGRFDTVSATLGDADVSETKHIAVLEVEVVVDEGC